MSDLILGRENPYATVFDARRWDVTHSFMDTVKLQGHVAKHLVGDRVKHMMESDIEDLKPGCGGICKEKGKVVAAYCDDEGTLQGLPSTRIACVEAESWYMSTMSRQSAQVQPNMHSLGMPRELERCRKELRLSVPWLPL